MQLAAHHFPHLGVWQYDLATQQFDLSEAGSALAGHPCATLADFERAVHPDDAAAWQQAWARVSHAGEALKLVVRLRQPSGTHRYAQVQAHLFGGLIVGTLQDIDERQQREQDLRRDKEAAEASTQSKSDFLSSMSHEIRTPMNAIMGLTDLLLQETALPTSALEMAGMIKQSSQHLLLLLNDILDLSKLEADKISFEKITFDLHQHVQDMSQVMAVKAREKGLRLFFYLEQGVPRLVKGDPHRLNQVLLNLLSNAIKFTPRGQVSLRVSAGLASGPGFNLSFAVQDTGIGIAEDGLSRIFQRFEQASTYTTRQYGGTGLGLSIAKRLVELQGGSIQVSSTPGVGSCFTVHLPFTAGEAILLPTPPLTPAAPRNLGGMHVLLVEDNVMNQLVAQKILTLWNATCDVASDGEEALTCLRRHSYDVVLMDLHLPGLSGLQVTEQIRSHRAGVLNPRVTIIALTADAFPETRDKTRHAGMDDCVMKPFDQELFFQALARHLPHRVDKVN